MIFIPGFLISLLHLGISLLTFPGIIVHEAAHVLACKMRGVAIFDVCYLRAGNPGGCVISEDEKDFSTSFLISIGPFLLNSLLCVIICIPAYVPIEVFEVNSPFNYLLMWLGVSIGSHAFPSLTDAENLFAHTKEVFHSRRPMIILTLPLILFIYLMSILSFIWADFLYGLALGIGLPYLIFGS